MEIQKEMLVKTLKEMRSKGFDYLKFITVVDYVNYLEVVYLLRNISEEKEEIIKVKIITKSNTENLNDINTIHNKDISHKPNQTDIFINTIIHIYPAADWYEREISEMFGIRITGRKIKRLLLEKWNGIDPPLRKTFGWGQSYKKEI